MKPAILYKKISDNKVQCLACSHYCKIAEGKTGICGVRQNVKGELKLLVYGKAAAVNVDPIEKKPLFHFLPGTEIYSIGTVGCNFRCGFCQNWGISQKVESRKLKVGGIPDLGEDLTPEKIVDYCVDNKIPSIAYTYNEPSVFVEYAYDTAKLAHEKGIKNVFVSNGFASKEAVEFMAPYLDAINIDLKSFENSFYQKECRGRLQPVLDNIKRYYDKGVWVEVTTLVIPGKNDKDDELSKIAEYLASVSKDIPWHISRFHPDYKELNGEVTSEESLEKAYDIGKKAGLNYVYVGNLHNEKLESTWCPKCKNLLVKREWGYSEVKALKDGKCEKCGREIKGVWQ